MRQITTNRHNSFDYSTDRQHAMRLLRDVLPTPVQSVQRVGHQSALALGFNWARACAERTMIPCWDKCVTEPDETQRVSYTLLCLPTRRQVQHHQRNAAARSRTRRQRYSSARRARSDIVQMGGCGVCIFSHTNAVSTWIKEVTGQSLPESS